MKDLKNPHPVEKTIKFVNIYTSTAKSKSINYFGSLCEDHYE